MSANIRIALTGGGSGGHVYPALAIGEIAKSIFPGASFLYIGTRRGAEAEVVPAGGIPLACISMESFRKSPLRLAMYGGELFRAYRQARSILLEFDPDLIIGTGGYSSAPVLLAGAVMKRRRGGRPGIFIHEQNVVAGLANRLGGKLADRIGTTFAASNRYFPPEKVSHVGYPLRERIVPGDRGEARRKIGIPEDAFVAFAFGGSAGSRTINRAVVDALEKLLEDRRVHVIHAVGRYRGSDYDPEEDTRARLAEKDLDAGLRDRYHSLVYTEDMGTYYAASDVVVSRCGSGTLFELREAGKPAVLLPKMGSAGEHQLHNALEAAKEWGAPVIRERRDENEPAGVMKVDGNELAEAILDLKRRPLAAAARRTKGARLPDAREKIGEILKELLK